MTCKSECEREGKMLASLDARCQRVRGPFNRGKRERGDIWVLSS
jgi:hypothetical protein